MVEINNQRKAFLDMLAWSEGTYDGRQKTRNHGDVIVGGELFTDYLITLAKLCHAKPKIKSTGADATSFFPLYRLPQAVIPERLLSEKSGRCGIAAD